MPSKNLRQSKTKSAEASSPLTNFRQIQGISQLTEARLHRCGIASLAQLAGLTPEEIIQILGQPKGITVEQIIAQDWNGQARQLAGLANPVEEVIKSEGFIVDLFLSPDKQVHSTQVLHVNSDVGDKWEHWDEKKLTQFITKQAGLVLPEKAATQTAITQTIEAESIASPAREQAQEMSIQTIEMIPAASPAPTKIVRQGTPFDIHLNYELGRYLQQVPTLPTYTATIFAKGITLPKQAQVGRSRGTLSATNKSIVVKVAQPNLPPGAYRLEAMVVVGGESHPVESPIQARMMFQVV